MFLDKDGEQIHICSEEEYLIALSEMIDPDMKKLYVKVHQSPKPPKADSSGMCNNVVLFFLSNYLKLVLKWMVKLH